MNNNDERDYDEERWQRREMYLEQEDELRAERLAATDWSLSALDRYSLGQYVTAEEADALAEIGEEVPSEQIGEAPAGSPTTA